MVSDVTSIVRLPQPPAILTPVNIAMKHFEEDRRDTAREPDALTGPLDKVLGTSDSNLSLTTPTSSSNYVSPLLKFHSYRLSPLYRTLFKQQLSSPTYSNTIKHNVIMCHHESQGKCSNKSCKAQHWSDVTMKHDDIINDFTRYLPPEKACSVQSTLSQMSSKLQNDQIQTMAAHVVYKELAHDDHVTISSQWMKNTAAKPVNVSQPQLNKSQIALEPITAVFDNKLTSDLKRCKNIIELNDNNHQLLLQFFVFYFSESSSFRYFTPDTQTDAKTTPTSILTDARSSSDDERACATLEKGLEQFPLEEVRLFASGGYGSVCMYIVL